MEELTKKLSNQLVKEVGICNYKSIVNMTIDLGRFNVIIGPNGSGKSNILEAIAFGNAGMLNKLDNEVLINNGIRLTAPQFMVNAFQNDEESDDFNKKNELIYQPIEISFKTDNISTENKVTLSYSSTSKGWIDNELITLEGILGKIIERLNHNPKQSSFELQIKDKPLKKPLSISREDLVVMQEVLEIVKFRRENFKNFLIYSPSEVIIRNNFEVPSQIMGIHGEGLFGYLKNVGSDPSKKWLIDKINDGLMDLDWFDNLKIPNNLMSNEYALEIQDRYISDSLKYFDQRSVNEGFLYLLFFLTIFNSPDTSNFFAIDNLETSFNPKLCKKLTKDLVNISVENNKQVIVTTHNPYVLDGLDLKNDDVRLFVARRNLDGHTCLERINYSPKRNIPLSELWMSGIIGGLPDNF